MIEAFLDLTKAQQRKLLNKAQKDSKIPGVSKEQRIKEYDPAFTWEAITVLNAIKKAVYEN